MRSACAVGLTDTVVIYTSAFVVKKVAYLRCKWASYGTSMIDPFGLKVCSCTLHIPSCQPNGKKGQ